MNTPFNLTTCFLINQEHAFDAFAVPDPVDDNGVFDDGTADNDYDDEVSDFSERAFGHAG